MDGERKGWEEGRREGGIEYDYDDRVGMEVAVGAG